MSTVFRLPHGKMVRIRPGPCAWHVIFPACSQCAHWSNSSRAPAPSFGRTVTEQRGGATSIYSVFTPSSVSCSTSQTSCGLLSLRFHHSEARSVLVLFCPYSSILSKVHSKCFLTYQKFNVNFRNEDPIHSKVSGKNRDPKNPWPHPPPLTQTPPTPNISIRFVLLAPSMNRRRHIIIIPKSIVYTRVHLAILSFLTEVWRHVSTTVDSSRTAEKSLSSTCSSLPPPYLWGSPIPPLVP